MSMKTGRAIPRGAGLTMLSTSEAMSSTGGTGEAPGGWYIEIVIAPGPPATPQPGGPLY